MRKSKGIFLCDLCGERIPYTLDGCYVCDETRWFPKFPHITDKDKKVFFKIGTRGLE